ncbi:hypothetical protein BMS3Abin01_00277 [bacterium BMS3Abin01]|nr:hypothetical protein BMS3Abin01_00277 [bacterium BMS3Abin01]HDY69875.1 DUF362 domain-containing protein [Actinomycetota bacterium]
MDSKVAVLKTTPETVVADYGRLMRMADYQKYLPRDSRTHLKINISWHVWYPACSTAPWQLEGVIKTLLDDGYDPDSLMLTQNRTVVVDDKVGEVNNGHATVARKYGLDFTRLYEPPVKWIRYQPQGEMLVLDKVYERDGIHIPDIFPGTNIIQLPTVKTHVFTGTTGAMKNAFGGLLQENRHWTHSVIHETLVDLLTIQKEIHTGLFAVMDGTICGDGPGPRAMEPYEKDYILASADQVAIDAVAAKMMGFDPMEFRYIRLAHERGLGCGIVDDIDIQGEDISATDFHFHGRQETFASRGQKAIYHGPLKPLEHALLRSPIVPWSYFASKFYHDYYWYPFVGWTRVCRMAETGWGQLQQEYLPVGAELEGQGRGRGVFLAAATAAAVLGMSAFARVAALARHRRA